ncbi:hypothetical protein XH80_05930 [Bradyrhizobium sp. CCBAU 45384]|nr:hypothetical protein [Bradyrhizobium sp. CCBAU 45384]
MVTRPQRRGEHREKGSRDTIDLAQASGAEVTDSGSVKTSDDRDRSTKKAPSRPTRREEARRAAEEYADDLRQLVRKLRARLLN